MRFRRIGNDFGTVEKYFQDRGIRLAKTFYPPRLSTPAHFHSQSYLALVLRGNYQDRRANTDYLCARHSVKFHRSNEYHSCTYGAAGVCQFTIQFDEQLAETTIPYSTISYESHISDLAYNIYQEFCTADPQPGAIESSTKRLLSELFEKRCFQQEGRWLEELKNLLVNRCEENWELSELARVFDRHPVYLAQQFKKSYGVTIGHFQRTTKIQRAKKFLLEDSCPIVEIAMRLGFADHSHFSKIFKQVVGCTPSQFRANRSA